jgi:hypothetical protein
MDPNLPDGVHDWREGIKFRKEGYKVLIEGTTTLAGSCCPLYECVSNLSKFASIPITEALLAATLRPAQLLGGEISKRKGQLREGFDADLCVVDWEGKVRSTWVGAKEVWRDGKIGQGDYLGQWERVGEWALIGWALIGLALAGLALTGSEAYEFETLHGTFPWADGGTVVSIRFRP